MKDEEQNQEPSFTTVVKKPRECIKSEIDAFVRLVIEGGQVDGRNLKQTVITRAKRLAFACDGEHIVGIAAIKKPARHYVMNVFKKADVSGDAANYGLEIAWCCTARQYRCRGISRHLVGKLLDEVSGRNYFATTAVGNEAMIKILNGLGFEIFGCAFGGRNGPIQLLTRRINMAEKHANDWMVKVRAAASRFAS